MIGLFGLPMPSSWTACVVLAAQLAVVALPLVAALQAVLGRRRRCACAQPQPHQLHYHQPKFAPRVHQTSGRTADSISLGRSDHHVQAVRAHRSTEYGVAHARGRQHLGAPGRRGTGPGSTRYYAVPPGQGIPPPPSLPDPTSLLPTGGKKIEITPPPTSTSMADASTSILSEPSTLSTLTPQPLNLTPFVTTTVLRCSDSGQDYPYNGVYFDMLFPIQSDNPLSPENIKRLVEAIIRSLPTGPQRQEMFRSPLISAAYERGWRQQFARAGFPGVDKEYSEVDEFFRPVRARVNKTQTLASPTTPTTITKPQAICVDLSCGSGLFTRRLVRSGAYGRVLAIDFSESMLLESFARCIVEGVEVPPLVRADVSSLPIQDQMVDCLHAGAALHCWPDVLAGLSECRRVMSPNGRAWFSTFLSGAYGVPSSVSSGAFSGQFGSMKFFEQEELAELFRQAGFDDDEVEIRREGNGCAIIKVVLGGDGGGASAIDAQSAPPGTSTGAQAGTVEESASSDGVGGEEKRYTNVSEMDGDDVYDLYSPPSVRAPAPTNTTVNELYAPRVPPAPPPTNSSVSELYPAPAPPPKKKKPKDGLARKFVSPHHACPKPIHARTPIIASPPHRSPSSWSPLPTATAATTTATAAAAAMPPRRAPVMRAAPVDMAVGAGDVDLVRNFCIVAHIDHGKSTLADRMLETTGTVQSRDMQAQLLDSMDLERERGITIKLNAVTMKYAAKDGHTYTLNLIDTPGHVDFSYEVSRSLAACEGALLVVDAAQGVEAQTMANAYLAVGGGLELVPVLNKIDLPSADPDTVAEEVENTLGLDCTDAIHASAKTGLGIDDILEAIVTRIPPPPKSTGGPLRALIYDSYFDPYRGVIVYFRVVDGEIRPGDRVLFMNSKAEHEVIEVGVCTPTQVKRDVLQAGEVGYMCAAIKSVEDARVGDTMTLARLSKPPEALPGYEEANPMVFCGLFPTEGDQYTALRDALGKLRLNDAALSYEPETSSAMGFGFRCGFLGLLHQEIVQERLEREYDLDLIVTAPSVVYQVTQTDGEEILVDNPAKMPDADQRTEVREPYCRLEMLTPGEYTGLLMELAQDRRGELVEVKYLTQSRTSVVYEIPLAEVITDLFDQIKSRSRGYASMEYHLIGFRPNNLVRLDVLINSEPAPPLSTICHKDQAFAVGKSLTTKLKTLIPRQLFKVPIQACIGSKPIASSVISPMRKDVLAKCYGGDISRKKKLLNKQAKGKKRMKMMGKVNVPQEAFLAVIKRDD